VLGMLSGAVASTLLALSLGDPHSFQELRRNFVYSGACGRPIERDGGPLATIALGAPESGFEATVFCSEGALAKVRL
jgi:hypothetical protein